MSEETFSTPVFGSWAGASKNVEEVVKKMKDVRLRTHLFDFTVPPALRHLSSICARRPLNLVHTKGKQLLLINVRVSTKAYLSFLPYGIAEMNASLVCTQFLEDMNIRINRMTA